MNLEGVHELSEADGKIAPTRSGRWYRRGPGIIVLSDAASGGLCESCGGAMEETELGPRQLSEEELASAIGGWALGKVGDYLFDRYGKPLLDRGADYVEGKLRPTPAVAQPARTGVAAAARAAASKAAANVAFQAKIPWIQTVLNSVDGTGLAADGMYGPATRAAVRTFRAYRGIPDEGVLGQRTETALTQAALNRLGARGLRENGMRDQATHRAIIGYQRSKGIAADGIVGPSTRAAMIADLAY